MITSEMFTDLRFKNIVYAAVGDERSSPIMIFDKEHKTYILKCFMTLKMAKEYLAYLQSTNNLKPGLSFDTDSFTTESIWILAKKLTGKTKHRIVLEVWGTKGEVDIGPFILYDSEEVPN
jgi:hypothetical protein